MNKIARAAGLCLAAWLAGAGAAHAHIKLLSPASWIQENGTGDPQKSSPCGPAAGTGMETGEVTTYTAGQEITVEWTETIPHNGHFRIALARERSELVDPKVNGACQSAEIQDPPKYPILADGLFPTTADDGKRMFSTKVTLPADMTCDNCTLQLIQFMTPHGAPCFYYHCANVKIVAGEGSGTAGTAAGGGAAAGGGGTSAAGRGSGAGAGGSNASGSSAAGSGRGGAAGSAAGSSSNPPSSVSNPQSSTPTTAGSASSTTAGMASPTPVNTPSDSGCSVATHAEANTTLAALFLLALTFSLQRRRPRERTRK